MPCEDGRRLHDMERRAPATPSVREPHPERTIKRRQAKAWTARATRDDQLVPQRDDLQVAAPRVNEPRTAVSRAGK
jgi:hypothetical protein